MEDDIKQDLVKDSKEGTNERWGWYSALYTLAGNDIRLRDAWLEALVVDFLQHLSFLHETQQHK